MIGQSRLFTSCAALLALSLGAGCYGAVETGPAYPGYDYDYPPDAYIATTEPYYWDGHPTYWYGGRWYYRDGGGRWGHYDREPPELHSRRMEAPPVRRGYEPYHGAPRAAPRGAPRGGPVGHPGGGGHGGRR